MMGEIQVIDNNPLPAGDLPEVPLFTRRPDVALDGFDEKTHERILFLGSMTFPARFSFDAPATHQSPAIRRRTI
jgi:hypothetical protein